MADGTSEMVERVSRAIYEVKYLEAWPPQGPFDSGIDPDSIRGWARAAILAMRELPEEPGPRYQAGDYSRRNVEAFIDDALA